jgi:hypothetical protein
MPRKKPLERVLAKIVDVQVAGPASGRGSSKAMVSLQVLINDAGAPRYEWLAVVSKPVRVRIRELMAAPDFVIGQRFALMVNEAGQVEGLQRVE